MKISNTCLAAGLLGLCAASAHPRDDAPPKDNMLQLSPDENFHFEILRAMAATPYEGADLGEVLIAANKIKAGDFNSFSDAFYDMATRVEKTARAIDARQFPVSARQALFRASTYYRSADFYLHGNWTDPRINSYWAKQRKTFDDAIALLPVPGKRVTIPSKDGKFQIPAIFYGSGLPGRRPTVLMCNGYDGSQEEMYHMIGQAVTQRGMNAITFEGPGQPTVRREQNLGFIPDWEKVLTPVVDWAMTRPEVDRRKISALGYSFGGYLIPRAAAFEKRLAAVFAIDGLYDFGASILAQFPPQLIAVYRSGNKEQFDAIVNGSLQDPSTPTGVKWSLQQGLWSFNTQSPYDWLTKTLQYNLTGVADKIRAPTFVGDAELEMFFPGQPKQLADAIGVKAEHHVFAAADGVGEHCGIGGGVMQNQVMFDWLDGRTNS